MEPLALLDGLEIKLRQLSATAERQRADHARVVAENRQLKRELDRQTGIVSSLKEKLARTQTSPSSEDPATPAPAAPATDEETRATIEFCLREIDRCLEWMQRH